jgi:hypothetical protein
MTSDFPYTVKAASSIEYRPKINFAYRLVEQMKPVIET